MLAVIILEILKGKDVTINMTALLQSTKIRTCHTQRPFFNFLNNESPINTRTKVAITFYANLKRLVNNC